MKNLEKNKLIDLIIKVTLLLISIIIIVGLGVSLYYNDTLQKQIYKRDILIEKLTKHDSILNMIIDIKYDSVSKTSTWEYRMRGGEILKYNVIAEELDKTKDDYNKIIDRHNEIIKQNTQNINDYNSLANSFTSLNQDHNKLIGIYKENIEKYNKMINTFSQVSDSLTSLNSIVKLAQSNYDITYSIRRNGNMKEISIRSDKLDSALVLLPFFRDRLKLDTIKNIWTIRIDKKEDK